MIKAKKKKLKKLSTFLSTIMDRCTLVDFDLRLNLLVLTVILRYDVPEQLTLKSTSLSDCKLHIIYISTYIYSINNVHKHTLYITSCKLTVV